MSNSSALPPMSSELKSRLWRAVCKAMDEDTKERLMIAGVGLDDNGAYAVAEVRIMERLGQLRLQTRVWPCCSMPAAMPALRWMSIRKFFGRMTPDGKVLDPAGLRYVDIHEWLFDLATRGEDLPDFPHAGPAKDWNPASSDSPRDELS